MASKNCSNVSTIQDVNNQYKYTDTHPHGPFDWNRVSCGQKNNSNELYDKYIRHYWGKPQDEVAKAMCECCKTTSGKSWDLFYECMAQRGFTKRP